MRDTPDRQLQLDFQRRAPELASIAPTLRSERALRFTALGSLRLSATGAGRRFLPTPTWPRLTSDVPLLLPQQHVNAAGFNARSEHLRSPKATASPPLAFAGTSLARRSLRQPQPTARSNEHDDLQRLLQSTRSPSTLAKDRYPASRRFSRRVVAPEVLRRRVAAPAASRPESAPCKARKPAPIRSRHPGHRLRPAHTGE